MVDDSEVGVRAQGGGTEPQRLSGNENMAAIQVDLSEDEDAGADLKGVLILINEPCPSRGACKLCNG